MDLQSQQIQRQGNEGGGDGVLQYNSIFIHTNKKSVAARMRDPACVWPGAQAAQGRTSRCFRLSRSPDVTFPVTRLSVPHFTRIQQGRSESWLIYWRSQSRCCLYEAGLTETRLGKEGRLGSVLGFCFVFFPPCLFCGEPGFFLGF